jgi:hypothetical protein
MLARKDAIKESSVFREVLKLIQYNSWLVLDLDNTVMEPRCELGSDQWFVELNKHACQLMPNNKEDAIALSVALYHEVQHHLKVKAIELNAIKMIKYVQAIGIPVIALTARGNVLKKTTKRQLQEIDINFDKIIFCEGKNKGDCLKAYLKMQEQLPSHIVMVDDKRKHLEHVMHAIESLEIPFNGIRYGFLDDKVNQFNFASTHIQLEKIKHKLPSSTKMIIEKFQLTSNVCSSHDFSMSDFFVAEVDKTTSSLQAETEIMSLIAQTDNKMLSNQTDAIDEKSYFKLH